ncbi:DciA family protein [Psychrobacter sp. FDAARGOS_221]|uniref:DciA family protein n=1 Tax=Psychrobacter sp. FDAARGOS_221 TaxID=1975705 RepID=UPI000BB583B7|nr:DciA family protein [Psychrobacter sp. FDAARGOS_221]PNK60233.1 DUF721 domain-containing protein [Psychrobacter sp. FDAARGOS_221]
MQNRSKPNHLAKLIDHQKSAASSLPKSVKDKFTELNQLTHEIKALLNTGLPEEILNTLWVVKYDDGNLVLSVQSQTAANHLRYQANNLIHILKEQSLTFSILNNIDVIVTYPASIAHLNESQDYSKPSLNKSNLTNYSDASHNEHGLTESTKRTITHTLEHVIKDDKLKRALKRLLKPN